MYRCILALVLLPVTAMASALEFRQGGTVLRSEARNTLPMIEELAEEMLPQLDARGRIVVQPVQTGTRVRLESKPDSNQFKVTVWQTAVVARGWKKNLCVPVLFSTETSTLVTCRPGGTATVPLPKLGAQLVFRRH